MVNISDILESNHSLRYGGSGLTAVVVGGTSGIGLSFLHNLAANTDAPTIYILGRSQTTLSSIIDDLRSRNPSGSYHPIETGDLTLIKSVDAAVEQLKPLLTSSPLGAKIDLLYLSPGYISLNSHRIPTPEGIDALTAIRYYSRMRFLHLLLPNLLLAPSPRVLTVLAGGHEGAIPDKTDLSLLQPKNYGINNAANLSATYTTLFLEHVHSTLPDASTRRRLSLIHLFPGLTSGTSLFSNPIFTTSSSPILSFLLTNLLLPILRPFLFTPVDQVGARALYAITNGKFRSVPDLSATDSKSNATLISTGSNGVVGSGVYTVNDKTEAVVNEKVLAPLRAEGWAERVYEHTLAEWEKALPA